MSKKIKGKRVKLEVVILPDAEFDKVFGADGKKMHAAWVTLESRVYLKESRAGTDRLEDWLHEAIHVWADCLMG